MVTNNYVDRTRGGVEMHVFNLMQALTASGHEVTVARTSPGASVHDVGSEANFWPVLGQTRQMTKDRAGGLNKIPALRFAFNFLSRISGAVNAGRLLRKNPRLLQSFDIIHHHDFITSAIIARMLAPLSVRQVWTNHLGEFLIIRRLPFVGSLITKYLTKPFCVGIGPSAELSDQQTVSCSISYIPNGVNTDVFTPLSDYERRKLRRRQGWKDDEVVAVVPRRWAPTKGVLYAAKAMSEIEWPKNCSALFAGSGETGFPEYSAQVRDALTTTKSSYKVIETLSIYEMAHTLQLADICVIPSLMEATSLSALEAMSACLPIVSTNVGGLPEIVSEGTNGLLVPPSDSTALATAVSELCNLTYAERMIMGQAARNHVISNYSWREIAVQTINVYRAAAK